VALTLCVAITDSEETAVVLSDEWFATGDVGHLDKKGRLYITDRKKDLLSCQMENNVAPQQIESLLKQSGFVRQVCGGRWSVNSRPRLLF